jgi:hypothetical protein
LAPVFVLNEVRRFDHLLIVRWETPKPIGSDATKLPGTIRIPLLSKLPHFDPDQGRPHRRARRYRMADANEKQAQAKREYTQLLRLHEQILGQFVRARDELAASGTSGLLKVIKGRTGTAPDLAPVKEAVEGAIRALKLSESMIQLTIDDDPEMPLEVEGIANMPAYLQRFLAERTDNPGFRYEVLHDPVRGWMVCWKEYTNRGTVRGYGQFCERPYAWLDD